MFSKKLTLIDKHLKDHKHPLRLLRKRFSSELQEYYQLFLDVNKQTLETQGSQLEKDRQDVLANKSPILSMIDQNQTKFIKQSFLQTS